MTDRIIDLAVLICTYNREAFVNANIDKLKNSKFFNRKENYYGHLDIFVVDNANKMKSNESEHFHVVCSEKNSGGSGGFQKALEIARGSNKVFSHVIFMDDDICFDIDSFYILYDFLKMCKEEDLCRPVAGRMFCMDKPNVQYTAAEIWNGGNIQHVEYMRDINKQPMLSGRVVYDAGADYGGWWFCCYPMSFAAKNDIIPFFIHCDDVEYGLRCGKRPIIIEGVQVWHETYEKRLSPIMQYYDTRNPLFVNELYGIGLTKQEIYTQWKQKIGRYHADKDWLSEYYVIRALRDYVKGISWLYKIDSAKYHRMLQKVSSNRFKNAILWRIVAGCYKRYERKNI